jgi:ABC-type uncharacterized transport system permease subunit
VIVTFHLLALGCYAVATACALATIVGNLTVPRALSVGAPLAGAAVHVAGAAQLTLVGLAPTLSVLALCLVVLQVLSDLVLRTAAVALFTGPLAVGLLALALLLGFGGGAEPSGGENAWFVLHVTLSVLGVAMLALAFISAALYLLQFRALKAKRFGQVFRYFPSLEQLDRLNRTALLAGFPTLTLGVLLALGYAQQFANGMNATSAQVVWGVFTWVVLGWAVWVRTMRGWGGRRAAFASIAGFSAVVLVYVALKLSEPGADRFL